jgi:hypothetical protein
MDLSETILAAIIGALATMGTAIFQLVRNRAPAETRPKKNRMRSTFAIVLLVVGAMVGGYFWSELRAVGAKEEIAALRADLKLAAREAAVGSAETAAATEQSAVPDVDASVTQARLADAGSAESVVHLPPCRVTQQAEEAGPTACTATLAATVAVCAIVPSNAHTTAVRVQARVPKSETPWLERNAGAATLGDLHIAAESTEYPASVEKRSVCVDVANWSVDDTLAVRVIVDYGFGPVPGSELTAAAPTGA